MKVKNFGDGDLTLEAMDAILARANTNYDGNLVWKRQPEFKGKFIHFTLTVRSSRDKGGRRSHSGRRIAAACWHAHRDFMHELFTWFPNAKLNTGVAIYDGMTGFMETFPGTGMNNIGSQMVPCRYRDACDCDCITDADHNIPLRPTISADTLEVA